MTAIPTPDDLTGLRALAIAATPGARKVCGATIVWSPSSQAVICAASELYPASGCVEYREPELGELAAPAANATFIAACDPQTIIGLLDAIDRLTIERDAARADSEHRWHAWIESSPSDLPSKLLTNADCDTHESNCYLRIEAAKAIRRLESARDAALAQVAQMREALIEIDWANAGDDDRIADIVRETLASLPAPSSDPLPE